MGNTTAHKHPRQDKTAWQSNRASGKSADGQSEVTIDNSRLACSRRARLINSSQEGTSASHAGAETRRNEVGEVGAWNDGKEGEAM